MSTHTSKFLSLVLRHRPEKIGLRLDEAGWVSVAELLAALARHNHPLSESSLHEIVAACSKQRFVLSEDGSRIRASQGHSVSVDLGYSPATPPGLLYHGTVARSLPAIEAMGLIKGNRHHVHLSPDIQTATIVARRRGAPVLLTVDAAAMNAAGHAFFLSANGVWLTNHVPASFIQFPRL